MYFLGGTETQLIIHEEHEGEEGFTVFINRLDFLGESLEERVNVSLAISLLPVNRYLWQRLTNWRTSP